MEQYYIQDISENLSSEQFTFLTEMYGEFLSKQLMEEINSEINK
jgi:hypothetical protein